MKHRFLAVGLSITMPGLGQLYNRNFSKGLILLVLEYFVNWHAHINSAIMHGFNGEHLQALNQLNYDLVLFYPGFYTFCAFDAALNADEQPNKDSAIWFIFSGLIGDFGVIYNQFLPHPLILDGLAMIFFMLIGTYVCSRGLIKNNSTP